MAGTSLSLEGLHVVIAWNDGNEALAAVRATPPELVLLDMNFSLATTGHDGLALLRQLKALAPRVPVVLGLAAALAFLAAVVVFAVQGPA